MKILLINPPFLPKYSRSSRSPAVTKSGTIYYPLWLAHAAGMLEKHGQEVLLLDVPARGGTLEAYQDRIQAFVPDVVVVDTSTPSIENDVEGLVRIKSWFLAKPPICVLVGTHPTALPEETFKISPEIDIIARGEYDWTLCNIADAVAASRPFENVLGISFRKADGGIRHNAARPLAENLDEIPFVSRVYQKHLNISDYFYAHCQNPVVSIFAGRGCPNRCFFCVYPQVMFGHRYRHRTVNHFVDELEFIAKEIPGVREVLIDDDNFTADQRFVGEICDEIIRRRIRLRWTAEVRVDLSYDVMLKMKSAGCRLIVAGFESGSQCVLNAIHKNATLAEARDFVKRAKKAKLRIHGCFMVGNRGETAETMSETLRFAMSLPMDTAQFFPLMVYPGTEAYRWAEKSGYLTTRRFRDWLTENGMHKGVVKTESLAPEELVDFCDRARRRFYLRPKYLVRKAVDLLLYPGEIGRTVKSASTLARHLFKKHR